MRRGLIAWAALLFVIIAACLHFLDEHEWKQAAHMVALVFICYAIGHKDGEQEAIERQKAEARAKEVKVNG